MLYICALYVCMCVDIYVSGKSRLATVFLIGFVRNSQDTVFLLNAILHANSRVRGRQLTNKPKINRQKNTLSIALVDFSLVNRLLFAQAHCTAATRKCATYMLSPSFSPGAGPVRTLLWILAIGLNFTIFAIALVKS